MLRTNITILNCLIKCFSFKLLRKLLLINNIIYLLLTRLIVELDLCFKS